MNYLEEINAIFKETLENPALVITNQTTSADVAEWDSLNHIYLVVAIEKHFSLKFTSSQIQSWKDVGEMVEDIKQSVG
jgi:acyl carrier protein